MVAAAGVRGHQRPTDAAVLAAAAIPNSPLLDGAVLIAAHFRYTLAYAFDTAAPRAPAVIVAEDDLLFSPDFYEYFHAVAPALEADSSLWLASAWVRGEATRRAQRREGRAPARARRRAPPAHWRLAPHRTRCHPRPSPFFSPRFPQNDNGFDYLVADATALKRTRFFPGLGWLLPRRVWEEELRAGWPATHWDHWMRDPAQHRGRDVLTPEIPRDYHAGVRGTFMDTTTHNRYFGSIAMQADARFTWDTPQGSDAINRALQPAYDARLAAALGDPATAHLSSLDAARAFRAGVGVVWYDCPAHVPEHPQMRGVAAFFGVWHEGGRGSREGVHELWWLGTARLILVNVCDPAASAGAQPVTGSIECAPAHVRARMPAGHAPISWAAFQEPGAHPALHHHAANFGAEWVSPLEHLEGGDDGNGPPDGEAAAADVAAAAAARAAAGARAGAGGGGGDGHDHGGSAHPHAHKRFMGDLVLPKRRPQPLPGALLAGAAGGGGGGGAAPWTGGAGAAGAGAGVGAGAVRGFLPASVALVASTTPGASCRDVCAAARPGGACEAAHLRTINDCPTLKSKFPCHSCQDSIGADQPAMIADSAPGHKLPGRCLVNGDPTLFSCDATYEFALRLCPCVAPP